jgi:putative MFS transporter
MTRDSSGGAAASKLRMTYTEFLDNSPMTAFLWLLIIGMCLAQLLDGMDFMATTFALPGIFREFHISPVQAGALLSSANFGLAIGAIFFPLLCDITGRKTIFQWVLIFYAGGTLMSAVAPSYGMLVTSRFIAGLGLGAQLPIVFSILAEFAPTRLRHIFIPLGPLFFAVGLIVAALLSIWLIPIFGWRAIYYVGVIPVLLIIFVRGYMPESIRFLLSKGKLEEASRITHDLARKAKMDVELVPPPSAQAQAKMSYGQQLGQLKVVWATTAILAIFYFCFFLQTWGINAWLPAIFVREGYALVRSFSYTLIILIAAPLSSWGAMYLQRMINRKWALFWLTAISAVFSFLFGLAFQHHLPPFYVVGAQFLQMLFGQGVVAILFTLSGELFPTSVRTLGIGIVNGVGRFGMVLGPTALGLFLKFGIATSHIIYYFAIPMVVAALLALFVIRVDPRQQSLEQISAKEQAAGGH